MTLTLHSIRMRCLGMIAVLLTGLVLTSGFAQEEENPRADAELKQLADAFAQASADSDKLRLDILEFRQRFPGTTQAVKAMDMLRRLPSPLDKIDAKTIPELERFDWQPKELVAVLGEHKGRHGGAVHAVAYSRNGKWLASGGSNSLIRIWDPTNMRLQFRLGHQNCLALAFNKESTMLVSAGSDGYVRTWDLSDGQPKKPQAMKVASTPLYALAVSPGGKLLASGGGDNRLYLWDITDDPPRETTAADGHSGPIRAIGYSPSGRTIVSASSDKTIRLWSVDKDLKAREKAVGTGPAALLSLAYHPTDDNVLVTGGADGTILLWNLVGVKPVIRQVIKSDGGAVNALNFSASGRTLASAHANGSARTWTVGAVIQAKAVLEGHIDAVTSVAFAPDSQSVATGSNDWTVRQWPTVTGPKPKDKTVSKGHLSHVYSVDFAPDGQTLISGSYDRTARLWYLATAEPAERPPLIKADSYVYAVAYSPDSKSVAVGGGAAYFRIHSVVTKILPTTFEGHKGQINRVEFSPNGNLIASASSDQTVRLWDARKGKDLHIFSAFETPIRGMSFSADGKKLAVTSGHYLYDKDGRIVFKDASPVFRDNPIRLYDVADQEELFRWKNDLLLLGSVGFTPDNRRLFCGGNDQVIRVWDSAARKAAEPMPFFSGYTGGVSNLVCSADGRWLASYGPNYRVSVWDVATGKIVKDWALQENFGSLAFAADSRHLAISLGTGVVYLLRLEAAAATSTK